MTRSVKYDLLCFIAHGAQHNRSPGLYDTRLLACNLLNGIAQQIHMIIPDVGDDRYLRHNHIRAVETTA